MSGPRNLFADLPTPAAGNEAFHTLLETGGVKIERIVSHAAAGSEGFWYDEAQDEWVVVLEGEATLRLLEPDEVVELKKGDHLFIPRHRKHRVERTSERTIWLAVHITR